MAADRALAVPPEAGHRVEDVVAQQERRGAPPPAIEAARLARGFKALRPAQLTALINRDDALLVDLSPIADFEKGHIAGARNIAPSQFDPEHKSLAKARDLPVVVTCRNGQASLAAARRLRKAGFTRVHWLDGGVAAWQQADLPLVRGRG